MKICHLSYKSILANENMSFIEEKYFSEWKYVVYQMKICHLSNENIYSKWKYVFYRMKIFVVKFCYFSATIRHAIFFSNTTELSSTVTPSENVEDW